jgi:LysR family transcriptional regulator, glycine cleavage system transcriptional activator
MSRLPSTTALLCFEAAARLGSFTRAAAELHLSQAGVSRQVIGLEQRLDDVRAALQRLERGTASVMALKGHGGRLQVSVASSLATYWLIPRLPLFTQAHPEITLNIATRVGPAEFTTGGLDASLEFGDGQRAGLAAAFVLPLQLQPYAAPVWVRQHGRLLTAPGIGAHLLQHATLPDAWAQWFSAARQAAPSRLDGPRHDLMSMVLHAALAGLGVALLPPFMVHDALQRRRLTRLSAQAWTSPRAYWLMTPEAATERPALRTFSDWLVRQV